MGLKKNEALIAIIIILIAVFAGVFIAYGVYLPSSSSSSNFGLKEGDQPPEFSVKTIDGNSYSYSSLKSDNQPYILYFFATWCPFCHEEFNELKDIYPKYQDKVKFLAVDLDLTETEEIIKQYKEDNDYPFEFAAGNKDILINYKVLATTTKYGIQSNGLIRFRGSGVISADDWEYVFQNLS